jgi:hypothetical protein
MRNGRLHRCEHGFGIVLGLEVRMVEVFGLLEHVLAKDAVVESGGGDGTHVVEAACRQRLRALHRVPRAIDVGRLLVFSACLQVIYGGEVEEVLDLALELLQVGVGDSEIFLRQVADDRDDILSLAPNSVRSASSFFSDPFRTRTWIGLRAPSTCASGTAQ